MSFLLFYRAPGAITPIDAIVNNITAALFLGGPRGGDAEGEEGDELRNIACWE